MIYLSIFTFFWADLTLINQEYLFTKEVGICTNSNILTLMKMSTIFCFSPEITFLVNLL